MTTNDYKMAGFILAIVGGLSSIGLGLFLVVFPNLMFPNLSSGLGEAFIIIQGFTIGGGIITLIGIGIAQFKIKLGKYIMLLSGIIAGGNILTIIGAIILTKKKKQGSSSYNALKSYDERSGKVYSNEKPPDKVFLLRISQEMNENGKEIINKICAQCGEKNNFKETESNIYQCLNCGANHHIRENTMLKLYKNE
jgi:hypothetical protein